MTEKLNFGNQENNAEALAPSERFKVNVDDYPMLRQQFQKSPDKRNVDIRWQIDRTVMEYVKDTAGLIAVIDGTARKYGERRDLEKPDHVIYLDKSARPVSWLVNMFWDDFSKEERPEHSYLSIDRMPWFRRVGLEPDEKGYISEAGGSKRRARASDFINNADKLSPKMLAGIRALYIDGGVETDDPEEIMKMPTVLDGKNVLIVDEVEDTGSTLGIARYLLQKAIPEIKHVDGDYFWFPEMKRVQTGPNTFESQKLSLPIWYKSDRTEGRGVGEVDEGYYRKKFEEDPTPRNRARMLGAFALSSYVNLNNEPGNATRQLTKEMRQLHDDYVAGKIFLSRVPQYDTARMKAVIEAQGVKVVPDEKVPDSYLAVMKNINSRKVEERDREI